MRDINNFKELTSEINRLTELKGTQETAMRMGLKQTGESLKPGNLIKSLFSGAKTKVKEDTQMKSSVITLAMSFFTGVVAKRLIVGKTKNRGLIKNFMGTSVEAIAAGIMSKYAVYIQAWIGAFFKELFSDDDKRIKDVTY